MRAAVLTIAVIVVVTLAPGCFEEPEPIDCSNHVVSGLEVGPTLVGGDWLFSYQVEQVGPAAESPSRRFVLEHADGAVPEVEAVGAGSVSDLDPESPVTTWEVELSELTEDFQDLPAGTYSATVSLEGYTRCAGAEGAQTDTLVFEATEVCEGGDLAITDLAVAPGATIPNTTVSWSSIYHFIDDDSPETGPFSMLVELIERDTGIVIGSGDFPAATQSSNVAVPHSIQVGQLSFVSPPEAGTGYLLQVELDPEEAVVQCDISDANHIQNDIDQLEL